MEKREGNGEEGRMSKRTYAVSCHGFVTGDVRADLAFLAADGVGIT